MKIPKTKLLLTFSISSFFLFGLAGVSEASNYYVSPSGSNLDPGTSEKPFKTIQRAADVVAAGDTVIVRDGVYSDSNDIKSNNIKRCVVVLNKKHGAPGNWITFRSENLYGAVIDGRNGARNYGFYLFYPGSQDAYIRIEGFEIKNVRTSGIKLRSPHNVYLYRNKIHGSGRFWSDSECAAGDTAPIPTGIGSTSDTYSVIVDSNIIYDIGRQYNSDCGYRNYHWDHNIYLKGSNWVIKNNILYNAHFGWVLKIADNTNTNTGRVCLVTNNVFAHTLPYSNMGHIGYVSKKAGDYIVVQNNIAYDSPGGYYNLDGHFIDNRVTLNSNDIFRNNVCSNDLYFHKPRSGSGVPTLSNNVENLSLPDFNLTSLSAHLGFIFSEFSRLRFFG